MNDEVFGTMLSSSIARMLSTLRATSPFLAERTETWIKRLSQTDQPEDYFKHPLAFPALLFPWWVECALAPMPDVPFQTDLIYSSVNGYYFIRMIDNVVDGHSDQEPKLLPLLSFFHTQLQGVYLDYFPAKHPFWPYFEKYAIYGAEFAVREGTITDIDLATFTEIVGKKVCGAKIPIVAVCYRRDRVDSFGQWEEFYDRFGCWHQMFNDLFGFAKDLKYGTPSYFLSEANRRKHSTESIVAWVMREGFQWGMDTLAAWMLDLKGLAGALHSQDLIMYLESRERLMIEQQAQIAVTLANLARIFQTA